MIENLVLGGGPAGLSAAYILSNNKKKVLLLEKDNVVGGLSKTFINGDFKFDLGGHRFFSKDEMLNMFLKSLVGEELINVPRTSRIFINKKYFNYPLTLMNSFFSMGILKSFDIFNHYILIKLKNLIKKQPDISFEDWIINRFGKSLYNYYFKPYTEKTWGISCNQISADWAAQRIKGMSLREAIINMLFFKMKKDSPKTLIKEFMYPKLGIGRISIKLKDKIEGKDNKIELNSKITKINHKNDFITSVIINDSKEIKCTNIISTIPITELTKVLNPKPPKDILEAIKKLKYRDEIFVFLMIDKPSITTDSWLYFPDSDIPFVRIHEPKNWSIHMVPEKKSSLVVEYMCNVGDLTWNMQKKKIVEITIKTLVDELGFFKRKEVLGWQVVKQKKAYPIYDVGYKEPLDKIKNFLKRFKNLQLIGRNGTFRYNNIDHSLDMGIKAAENLLGAHHNLDEIGIESEYFEVKEPVKKKKKESGGFFRSV